MKENDFLVLGCFNKYLKKIKYKIKLIGNLYILKVLRVKINKISLKQKIKIIY